MAMHEVSPDDPLYGQPLQGPNFWPDDLPELRESALAYMERLTALGRMMAGGLAEALGLPRNWFARYFRKPTLFLRLLHYPRQADEDGLYGFGAPYGLWVYHDPRAGRCRRTRGSQPPRSMDRGSPYRGNVRDECWRHPATVVEWAIRVDATPRSQLETTGSLFDPLFL